MRLIGPGTRETSSSRSSKAAVPSRWPRSRVPRPGLFLPTLGRPSQPAGLTLEHAAGAVLYATGDAEVGIAALAQERRPVHWMLRHEDISEVQDAQCRPARG